MFNWQDLFVVFSVIYFLIWWQRKPMRELASKIPGPKSLLIFGVAHKFFAVESKDIYSLLVDIVKPFVPGNRVKVWFGPWLAFFPFHPEDVKIVLNSEHCQDKPLIFYKELFNFGLISMNGEEYKVHRKTILPTLFPKNLRSFVPIIDDVMDQFLANFSEKLKPEVFDLVNDTLSFAVNSVFTTLFGLDNIDETTRLKLVHNAEEYAMLASDRTFKPWYKLDVFNLTQNSQRMRNVKKELHTFFGTVVEDHEREYQKTKTKTFATTKIFQDRYYSLREMMTYEETLEGILMFLGASFDTTGKTIPSILLLLAMNQDEQDKVYEEIQTILTPVNDKLDEEKLVKMIYLDLIIKESLRLIPPIPVQARQASKDVELKTCTIPKGTLIMLLSKEIQTNRDLWGEDAKEFKPERFLEENIKKIHPYAYFPFSNGPRICPGMKYAHMVFKIFLSKFLLKYRVTTELKYDQLEFQMRVTTVITQGYMMKVERR